MERKNNTAESLIEVIIAVSVITTILVPASGLYVTSLRNTSINRNDLIAATLAEEGLEVMRHIRDTNFLRFSPKASECWNTKPDHTDLDGCENNTITAGSYKLIRDNLTLKWRLENSSPPLTPELIKPSDSFYQLKLDLNPNPSCDSPSLASGTPCHNHFINDTHLYNHTRGTSTIFYRSITIEYFPAPPTPTQGMKVISLVRYRSGTGVQNFQLITRLTSKLQ